MVDPPKLDRQLEDCGWEATRRANLLYFASLPVEERVQWLADMLELVSELREAREAREAAENAGCDSPTDRGRSISSEAPSTALGPP